MRFSTTIASNEAGVLPGDEIGGLTSEAVGGGGFALDWRLADSVAAAPASLFVVEPAGAGALDGSGVLVAAGARVGSGAFVGSGRRAAAGALVGAGIAVMRIVADPV